MLFDQLPFWQLLESLEHVWAACETAPIQMQSFALAAQFCDASCCELHAAKQMEK